MALLEDCLLPDRHNAGRTITWHVLVEGELIIGKTVRRDLGFQCLSCPKIQCVIILYLRGFVK